MFPARHYASSLTDPALPPMGLRVRLKASFDTSGFAPQPRVILDALKRYGMMVADNGSNWYISGAPDPGWNDDDLHQLGSVKGSDFEVVDTSSPDRGDAHPDLRAAAAVDAGEEEHSTRIDETIRALVRVRAAARWDGLRPRRATHGCPVVLRREPARAPRADRPRQACLA